MLVLSRKINESIIVDGQIRVTVLGIRGNQVRLGIEAPASIKVVREELINLPRPEHAEREELVVSAAVQAGPGRGAGPLTVALEKHHAYDVTLG